jgi:nucleoside-diphosphate-sugar epimerase
MSNTTPGLTLLTGAGGYLGRHLLDSLLADGVPVRVLVHSEWKADALAERGVEVVLGDVTEPETLAGVAEGVETVYHLVGGGTVGGVDPFLINTTGTRHMLAACRGEANLRSFVYVSSSTVYGRRPDPVDETSTVAPRFDYARSKLQAEELLLEAAADGFPAKIARLAGVYGHQSPMFAVDALRRGKMRIIGPGENFISVIHVDDAVRAVRALAERGRPGEIVCLSDDEPVPLYTFHNTLAQLLGAPPVGQSPVRRVQMIVGMVRFLARLLGRTPPLTEAVVEMSTLDVRMQNDRMVERLGVELYYPTYRQGLAQVAALLLAAEEEE